MTSFTELYNRLLKAALGNSLSDEVEKIQQEKYDAYQLDCLLNPKNHPAIIRIGECDCDETQKNACAAKCLFDSLYKDENGNISVNMDLCVGCGDCIENCHAKKLVDNKDVIATLEAVKNAKGPVYAMIAPAFVNQYSAEISPSKLRAAFKRLGFTGMVEVALFADILTLKEALEFDKNIVDEKDYQLTSCCCPMWIAMISVFTTN